MKIKILALLCIPFILGACSSPEEPEISLHIEGTVTYASRGKPIESVYIQLFEIMHGYTGASTRTNREGRYVLRYNTKCLKCEYSVIVGSGGAGKAKRIKLINQIQIIDFQL